MIKETRRKTYREDHARDMSIYNPRRKILRGTRSYRHLNANF